MDNNKIAQLNSKVEKILDEIACDNPEIREIPDNNRGAEKSHGKFWSVATQKNSLDFGSEISEKKSANQTERKLFAILEFDKKLPRLNLRCDENLAKLLREKYESVSRTANLSSRRWITILLTGQIPEEKLFDLIRHAANIAKND